MVALEPPIDPVLLRYVNRLSDLLFVLARLAYDGGRADVLWEPGASVADSG
jgi:cob(I)alamin adenosyltransferase